MVIRLVGLDVSAIGATGLIRASAVASPFPFFRGLPGFLEPEGFGVADIGVGTHVIVGPRTIRDKRSRRVPVGTPS